MEEVRSLNLEDIGNILAFWDENRKVDEKQRRTQAILKRGRRGK